VQLTLIVHYPAGYPDELPNLSLEAIEGELKDDELQSLLDDLHTVVRLHSIEQIPFMIELSGRGKHWDSYDIHSSLPSERTIVISGPLKSRKDSQSRGGEGATSFGGIKF
jgi:hypothetical protein